MSQLNISLEQIDPVEFLGVHNSKLYILKKSFPKLKIVSRGNKIKITGAQKDVNRLKERINLMIQYIDKYGFLSDNIMQGLLADPQEIKTVVDSFSDEGILAGSNGSIIKAKTPNQQKMVDLSGDNDIVFAIGPAGTGKTYVAVALAVRALKKREVKRIILTRPAVEAGENLGFLPGDIKEKVDPYLRPLYDAIDDMLPRDKIKYFIDNRVIEIAPLAFMRGRTLDKAYIILDEAQNARRMQIKMFLTRLGPNAKCIITGDLTQIDLPKAQESGLLPSLKIVENIKGIETVYLTDKDVIRHKLVGDIIKAYDKAEKRKK